MAIGSHEAETTTSRLYPTVAGPHFELPGSPSTDSFAPEAAPRVQQLASPASFPPVEATGLTPALSDVIRPADRTERKQSETESFRDCSVPGRRLRLDGVTTRETNRASVHPEETPQPMPLRGISDRLATMLATARRVLEETESDGVLLLAERPLDWQALREKLGQCKFLIAASSEVIAPPQPGTDESPAVPSSESDGIHWIRLEDSEGPTHDRLSLALLEAVANEHLRSGASVVALYRGFDDDEVDSLSVIRLDEHLERLTAADLRKLETQVPLDTLKAVVDLAVEIGREGREGHPVGTLFVVGDTRKVMKQSRPMGFDPFHGYSAKEKSLRDRRVREEIKEIAQLDGAIIIDAHGNVAAARQYIDSSATGITMSRGLGSRHWAAAAVTKSTKAIGIVVSQSSGTVRIFQNGQIVLRIEPLRRAMKWQEFEAQPPEPPEWLA